MVAQLIAFSLALTLGAVVVGALYGARDGIRFVVAGLLLLSALEGFELWVGSPAFSWLLFLPGVTIALVMWVRAWVTQVTNQKREAEAKRQADAAYRNMLKRHEEDERARAEAWWHDQEYRG